MIQGYVGRCRISTEFEFILISRRRWPMGGSRFHCRGLDEHGNAANCVESEVVLVRTLRKDKGDRYIVYSHT